MMDKAPDDYRLYGAPGWGSVLVEAALVRAKVSFVFEDVSGFDHAGPARERLLAVNPLAQVPVLVLPGGEIMTESAAIVLYLAETHTEAGLAPPSGDPLRPIFLRRLMWLAASVYPTFLFADYPGRWAPGAEDALVERVLEHRKNLWRQWEAELKDGPWALGERFSALDLFVGAMTRWRPRREWFEAECPKLAAIAQLTDAEPDLAPVWARNFG
jgi:GST-like protein